MRKVEMISIFMILIGFVLKILEIPGSLMLFGISTFTLGFLYFYFGFAVLNNIPLRVIFKKVAYQGIGTPKIIGAIFAGIVLCFLLMSVLFKVMQWSGSGIMIYISIGLVVILSMAALVLKIFKYPILNTGTTIRLGVLTLLALIILIFM